MSLSLNNVSKNFNKLKAVDNINIKLESGIYGLLGANGAGKSTLMEMLCTLQAPTRGRIEWNGQDIYSLGDRYRNYLGYLPQKFGCYPNFTTYDFLNYIAILKGIDSKTAEETSYQLLKVVGLSGEKNKKVKALSGGMKQRLGIAQALINDPKILILDEPTAGLDPEERVKFRNLINRLAKDKIIILSTHIVSDIEYMAKEILIMKKGKIICTGKPDDIINSIDGWVWECIISENEINDISPDIVIANLSYGEKNNHILRFIAKEGRIKGARKVQPTLEDVYLYHFGMKSKN